jgi:hypothetical protein
MDEEIGTGRWICWTIAVRLVRIPSRSYSINTAIAVLNGIR